MTNLRRNIRRFRLKLAYPVICKSNETLLAALNMAMDNDRRADFVFATGLMYHNIAMAIAGKHRE